MNQRWEVQILSSLIKKNIDEIFVKIDSFCKCVFKIVIGTFFSFFAAQSKPCEVLLLVLL